MRRLILFALVSWPHLLLAEDKMTAVTQAPVFVAAVPNPHDYSLFANGGWDGNWYVGYNTCWIKKLPPIPTGDYARAFIGAKLGRMKLQGGAKSIWDKAPVQGSVYMALASTTAWAKNQSVELITTNEIPLEGDYEVAVEGIGESQWFWVEIPLKQVNWNGENFLALWSPSSNLVSVSSSPVLAAASGGKDQNTWLLRDVAGAPPRTPPASIGSAISYFQPAMAMKLIRSLAAHRSKSDLWVGRRQPLKGSNRP